MTLIPGTRLGPYEVATLLGAGGMGEVYRARDSRLGRDVAIKVLPASFSQDADRLRRFEHEARAAGVLNHPNITAVYDIGTHEGSPYVVEELLEGETLRSELAGEKLPLRRAIDYALQTARGLAAAHEITIMTRYGARPIASDFFSAFIGVRIPLYAGRKQLRLADAARAEVEAARAGLADEQAALAEEIRTVRAQIRSGATRLRLLTDRVVPSAQATVDATLRNYRVGQVQFLTVLATEDALYRAQLDAARVAAEHLTHLIMLEKLLAPEDAS